MSDEELKATFVRLMTEDREFAHSIAKILNNTPVYYEHEKEGFDVHIKNSH